MDQFNREPTDTVNEMFNPLAVRLDYRIRVLDAIKANLDAS